MNNKVFDITIVFRLSDEPDLEEFNKVYGERCLYQVFYMEFIKARVLLR